MKKIVKCALNNPVTVLMVVLAVLLLGKISYDRLGVDLLPKIDNPKLFIELEADNKPPQEIEKDYIEQIEAGAIRQNKVLEVSSVIQSGFARVMVKYDWSKDMDDAYIDLQKAISPMLRAKGINQIKITQHNTNSDPVEMIAVYNDSIQDMSELRKVGEGFMRTELIRVDGVAEVLLKGVLYNEMRIKTNPYKLKAFGLSVGQIASKINSNNQVVSGGIVTEDGINYIVKGKASLDSEEDFNKMIVGYKAITNSSRVTSLTDVGKAPITLGDVATISYQNADAKSIVRLNGRCCMGLYIYKEHAYNTVKVVENINEKMVEVAKALPGYHFKVVSNQGDFINNSISDVKHSALLGIFLAILVLYVFLRSIGTTLIISLSIPISIVATFSLMYFGGLTLNIMTLGGLALGAGMLVDNAIVVIESIFRLKEKGLSIGKAAVEGTSQVGSAIIASTLTTIVVFLPIVYLHGASGELFKDQAWTVTFSLVSSLLVAIFVIPTLFYKIYSLNYFTKKKQKKFDDEKSIHLNGYTLFLGKVLDNRLMVILVSIAILLISVFVVKNMGSEFIPSQENQIISMNLKLADGTELKRTNQVVKNIEKQVVYYTQDSLSTIYSFIGSDETSSESLFQGENTAKIRIYLSKESKITAKALMAHLSELSINNPTLKISFNNDANVLSSMLSDESAPITVEVKGDDLDEIAIISKQVVSNIKDLSSIYNITSTNEDGAPQIDINVNREFAGINGISSSDVASQVQAYLEGKEAGKIESKGEMKDIVIKLPDVNVRELGLIPIQVGNSVYLLQEIAKMQRSFAPKEIYRRNQHRICRINALKVKDVPLDKISKQINQRVENISLPNGYSIKVTGQEELRKESMHSLFLVMILSIILVYMVLASQFESLLHPFTILLTIPLAIVGAIWTLWIFGVTLNMIGLIGIIMLCGIAVNNSILLVDRISQLKKEMSLLDAIIEGAGQRIRPILMTTLTTILALVPMAVSFGNSSTLRMPLALAVIGGLITSTLMSLVVIPCVYYYLDTLKNKILKR